MKLPTLLREARACDLCAKHLPEGPKPLLQAGATARVLIIGQAPGLATHQRGVPWDDASGQRLRTWLGVSAETFYSPSAVALIPMGFCYPGKGSSGDAPPRPECAPRWHPPLLKALPEIRLKLYLGTKAKQTLCLTDIRNA